MTMTAPFDLTHPASRTRGAVIALTLAIGQLAGCAAPADVAGPPRPAMVVQPAPVTADYQVFPGEVHARYEPALAFRVGGKIARRLVDTGEHVTEGQVLAELEPEDLRLQSAGAAAQLAAADADLQLARSELDRHQNLLDRQLISRSLFEQRQSQFRAAEARAQQAKAQLDVADNQAGYALLRASQAGVITQRLAEAGQVVGAGQTVFVLAVDGEREVAISLPEQGIEQFSVGQPVMLGLWSKPDQRIRGSLREISPSADPSARTYAARVTLEAEAPGIELGQSARALFARNGKSALGIPLSALTADGGQHFVWVLDPSTATVHRKAVDIGPFGDDSATVLAGIVSSDWIVSGGVHLLQEGQPVKAVDRDNRPVAPPRG